MSSIEISPGHSIIHPVVPHEPDYDWCLKGLERVDNRDRLSIHDHDKTTAIGRWKRSKQMAKQVVGDAKFQVPGGQATPAPPVGTSLGKFGINLGQFVQQFNDRTKEYNGTPIPVIVTVSSVL